MPGSPALVDDETLAYYIGRPASTIRRWRAEGRIAQYGSGRGNVLYDVREFVAAERDEWTGEVLKTGGIPELMPDYRKAA
ncbi:DNA-binding protein [Streptomyces sp. NPDC004330]|uniref:DNA-binding protein n=1 Tax=Streptomyces sp. NPDC004330 TaxID=3364700 RepID=UPI0036858E8E